MTSSPTIRSAFFGAINLDRVTQWAVNVDYTERFALVAETGTPRRIIAHAAYIRLGPKAVHRRPGRGDARAEVAFLIADAWQGRGICPILLAQLGDVAEQNGIGTICAHVLPANHRMIEVFRASGFPVQMHSTPDASELDYNPLIAGPHGAVIVDAHVRVETAPPSRPTSSLRA